MLVPLIKELKRRGHKVWAICTPPFGAIQMFEGFQDRLFEDVIDARSLVQMGKVAIAKFRFFDEVYLDYFSSSNKFMSLAALVGKQLVCNHIPHRFPDLLKRKIKFIYPIPGLHEGVQYLRYSGLQVDEIKLTDMSFRLMAVEGDVFAKPYISIQPGAGNNAAPWKVWPADRWIGLVKRILEDFPDLNVRILGDEHEAQLLNDFRQISSRVSVHAGDIKLSLLPQLLSGALIHLGGDSGLMHIAGCLGTPTVIVFGASDPEHFGWEKLNPVLHVVVRKFINCQPCNRWILPNRSRVAEPALCPDFKCLSDISLEEFYNVAYSKLKVYAQ